MKTKIVTLSLVLLSLTMSSFAGIAAGEPTKTSSKKIRIEKQFKKIELGANIKLVLVPASTGATEATATGEQDLLDDLNIRVKGDKLYITTDDSFAAGNELVVYIPVSQLSEVELGTGATVTAQGHPHFEKLTVFVNVDSKVDLQVSGKVALKTAADCDFIYVARS